MVVSMGVRQLEECVKASDDAPWQLWNVENLAQDAAPAVRITCYEHIPENAYRAVQLCVDLKKCSPTVPR